MGTAQGWVDAGACRRFTLRVRDLPTGTVTFVFTDVEGSTALLQELGERYADVLNVHKRMLREAFAAHGGVEVDTQGDALFVAFARASDAVAAVVDAQERLREGPVRVRMGIHTGEPIRTAEGYVGIDVHRAARIAAAGHGGQVLVSQTTRDLLREGAMLDLGPQRFKGLEESEHVYQLVAPGLARDFPPLRSLDVRGNVPLPMSSFIGRESELAAVIRAFDETRLATLTGVGGVGKTTLAIHAAIELEAGFPDGAWLVELAPLRDPEAVVATVATMFSLVPRPGLTLLETLVEYLRSRRILLVLDNCEHLLEPAAEIAGTLVRLCSELAVLATSREPLAVAGENVLPVPPLEEPAAIRLFAERARAAKPGFELTGANEESVGEVCRRLDGIALAVELAAARVGVLSPQELVERLDERFRVLTANRRGAPPRHQTLRATIDWSYQLLSASEQRLLARLAVFAGGCTLAAAEEVCAGGSIDSADVFALLANLVDRSLVVTEEQDGETRYQLLETIREFAQGHLEGADEPGEIRARHARYFAGWAETASHGLRGPAEAAWSRRVARDHENLRAAMAYAIESDDADIALRLLTAAKLIPMYFLPIAATLAGSAEAALGLSGAREHPLSIAAYVHAGTLAWAAGDLERTETLAAEGEEALRRLGLQPDQYLDGLRAFVAIGRGRTKEVIEIWASVLPIDRAKGDDLEFAGDLGMLAFYRALNGDRETAIAEATEALAAARAVGNPSMTAYCLGNLGFVLAESEPARARELLRESIEIAASIGRPDPQAHGMLALIAAQQGNRAETIARSAEALGLEFWFADRISLGAIFAILAHALASDDPERAALLEGAGETLDTGYASFLQIARLREETGLALASSLGEERSKELHAKGSALTLERAVAVAREAIASALG